MAFGDSECCLHNWTTISSRFSTSVAGQEQQGDNMEPSTKTTQNLNSISNLLEKKLTE